ncbi:MAG: peptide-methionine (S)-S-oxide reductase MsrA [Halobacteriovoraceae bacterium]|nr:peptide-methionine (S)-S-oxide reductase MsrA [Halobacteriovoraceae bacterium]
MEKAIFAAGCFWHVQKGFDEITGVISTEVGYTGGIVENPTYQMVCKGDTGHAEAVRIKFDPEKITYDELLNIFWQSHNPTTKNRQGPDVGPQYRSAIFYLNEQQREIAENSLLSWRKSAKISGNIVTEITASAFFYRAEEYHQNYFKKINKNSSIFCDL